MVDSKVFVFIVLNSGSISSWDLLTHLQRQPHTFWEWSCDPRLNSNAALRLDSITSQYLGLNLFLFLSFINYRVTQLSQVLCHPPSKIGKIAMSEGRCRQNWPIGVNTNAFILSIKILRVICLWSLVYCVRSCLIFNGDFRQTALCSDLLRLECFRQF